MCDMPRPDDKPKKLGELIDHIERVREELLNIQRSLEKMEAARPTEDSDKE